MYVVYSIDELKRPTGQRQTDEPHPVHLGVTFDRMLSYHRDFFDYCTL